jgi:hypothetical protein
MTRGQRAKKRADKLSWLASEAPAIRLFAHSLLTAFDDQDVYLQVVYVQQPLHSFGPNRMIWHKAMAWN